MREVGLRELVEEVDDPFLRHQVDGGLVLRAWVEGCAAVVEQVALRPPGPVLVCVGPTADLGSLMDAVAPLVGRPGRIVLEAAAHDALPATWVLDGSHRWTWMLTRALPPAAADVGVPVEALDTARDAAAIEAVLAIANPTTSARRDLAASECWVGVRAPGRSPGQAADAARLVAVGAVVRRPGGAGHLAGIAVHPDVRRRGIGVALTAELTRRALAPAPHVATLGLYTENVAALGVYRRLGYEVAHEFVSVTRSSR